MSDIESNILNPINSKYYFPSDSEKLTLQASSSYFSLFHINLISFDAHLSDLQTTLASLNFLFHIIGINETRENISIGFKWIKTYLVLHFTLNPQSLLLLVWRFILASL